MAGEMAGVLNELEIWEELFVLESSEFCAVFLFWLSSDSPQKFCTGRQGRLRTTPLCG